MRDPQRSENGKTGKSQKYPAWLALAAIWLLAELPTVLAPDGLDLSALRPTGEILALLTIAAVSDRVPFGRVLRWLAIPIAVVLAVVRVDRAVFFVLTRSEPLLYDQLFMLRHLFVMLSDVLGLRAMPAVLGVVAGAALVVWLVGRLLRRAAPLLSPARLRTTVIVGATLWVLTLGGTLLGLASKNRHFVRWMVPDLAQNLAESERVYHAVQETVTHSEYAAFDRVKLRKTPDIFFFFVESYGKIFAEEPQMSHDWKDALRDMEHRMSPQGWDMASGYGVAPVSGGRSWLAVGSVLLGTRISYEAEFHQLTDAVGKIPTLVRFLSKQGYRTILLAPSDRERPGVEVRNDYGFDQDIAFDQLDYQGPRIGFGLMPDQYALGYVEEHVLPSAPHPLFFAYQMVSSHADWKNTPRFVADWHTLNHATGPLFDPHSRGEISGRLQRYSREENHWAHMGHLTAAMRDNYEVSIFYDLHVIEDFLSRRADNTLVIVMGDHEPPILSPAALDFEVPIHLFTRDPSLLAEFTDQGFTPGLISPADRPATVRHEGLYSLIVRALARCCGDGSPLPKYYPNGTATTSVPGG